MLKKIALGLTFITTSAGFAQGVANSQDEAWISDDLRTSINDAPNVGGKFLGSVSAGTPVKILAKSDDDKYVQIKTDEFKGWIPTRNIMYTPSIHARYQQLQQQLETLKVQALENENKLQNSSNVIEQLQNELVSLRQQEAQAQADLVAIKRISGNVVAMDTRNRELQASVVELEQKNLELRHQNARLEEKIHNRELYIGGALVLLGFVLHWLAVGFFNLNRSQSRFNDF